MRISFTGDYDKKRNCDPMGCGYFGAPRGARKHKGQDIVLLPNENWYAPFKLKIKRFGKPYSSTQKFDLVEFTGFGVFSIFSIKVFYTDTVRYFDVGDIVNKGEFMGHAQDIADYHKGGMINHLHVEVYCLGKLINPSIILKLK